MKPNTISVTVHLVNNSVSDVLEDASPAEAINEYFCQWEADEVKALHILATNHDGVSINIRWRIGGSVSFLKKRLTEKDNILLPKPNSVRVVIDTADGNTRPLLLDATPTKAIEEYLYPDCRIVGSWDIVVADEAGNTASFSLEHGRKKGLDGSVFIVD